MFFRFALSTFACHDFLSYLLCISDCAQRRHFDNCLYATRPAGPDCLLLLFKSLLSNPRSHFSHRCKNRCFSGFRPLSAANYGCQNTSRTFIVYSLLRGTPAKPTVAFFLKPALLFTRLHLSLPRFFLIQDEIHYLIQTFFCSISA